MKPHHFSSSESIYTLVLSRFVSFAAFLMTIILPLNIAAQQTYYTVEITVTGCLDTLLPGTQVTLTNYSTPPNGDTTSRFSVCDSASVAFFDSIVAGTWDLKAYYPEYEWYEDSSVVINGNYTTTIHLLPVAFPPRRFKVDTLTSIATWIPPVREALPYQDFEDTLFPPPGWQNFNITYGTSVWWRDNHGSEGFLIPPGDGYYAEANSNSPIGGSNGNVNAYLVTPSVDLRAHDNYELKFRSYFDGSYGQLATVEYSIDSGDIWELLYNVIPNTKWVYETIDLSNFSGSNGEQSLFIGFHADDNGNWASGWAIDNVYISAGSANPDGYFVYLDNDIVDYINHDTNSYTFQGLDWGQTYTGGLVATYPCRASEQVQYTWTSSFLYPPRNFSTQYSYGTNEVMCSFQAPAIVSVDSAGNLVSYNIFQDDSLVDNIHYQGEPADYTYHVLFNPLPGTHTFKATAVYELSIYGYPGDTAESAFTDTSSVYVAYGFDLPFNESWNSLDFQTNYWSHTGSSATWKIDRYAGNPPGAAKMVIIPDSTAYAASLISYYFNCDSVSDGAVYLDFDIKVASAAPDPSEKLIVEVYNGFEWVLYHTFYSSDPLDFTTQHFDISEDAKHQVFKIRFSASGNSCNTGTVWWIDNIVLYRTCAAPKELTGIYYWADTIPTGDDYGIKLSWNKPDETSSQSKVGNSGSIKNSRSLQSFNIYRKAEDEAGYTLYANVPFNSDSSNYSYYDSYPNISMQKIYYYQVTALWEDGDECESEPAKSLENPNNDFVFVYVTGANETEKGNRLNVYPNPATDKVNLSWGNNIITEVDIYSQSGILLRKLTLINSQRLSMDISDLPPGLYLFNIKSKGSNTLRKVVVE